MANFFDLIKREEGWRSKPYRCSTGYPTVGFGFKIGPKGSPMLHYDFELPEKAGEAWLRELADELVRELELHKPTREALAACLQADGVPTSDWINSPRASVLVSMAYQMGVWGLLNFTQTLRHIRNAEWTNAQGGMLRSLWAQQTPHRAKRHGNQMSTGLWDSSY